MTRPLSRLVLVALPLLMGGIACQRCAKERFDPISLAPQSSAALVLVEPLGALAPTLERALRLVQGEERAQLEELKAQLGFDPLKPEGWREAGLDPARSALLVATAADAAPVLVLPVGDAAKLEQTARRLAERLGRADKVSEPQIAGGRGLSFARSFGDREVPLATLRVDAKRRYALVAVGRDGVAAIEALLATKPDQSLAAAERFRVARARVRQGPLFVWTGGAAAAALAEELGGSPETLSHIVASAGADGEAIWLDSWAGLSVDARKRLQAALALDSAPPNMVELADADAVLVAAGTANVATLLAEVERRQGGGAQGLDALARSAGVDLNRAVLERMRGGVGGLFFVGDVALLGPLLRDPRALARTAGSVLEIFIVAELTAAGAGDVQKVLADYFAGRGLEVTSRSTAAGEVSTVAGRGGGGEVQLHYAVRGQRLLFGLGAAARFDALLSQQAKGGAGALQKELSAPMRELLRVERGGQLYLSFTTLAKKLRQLSQAPGLGDPAARSVLIKVGDALSRFGSLGMTLNAEDDGLRLRARLEVRAGGGEGQTP